MDEKKMFVVPAIEVLVFNNEDIIVTSLTSRDGTSGPDWKLDDNSEPGI